MTRNTKIKEINSVIEKCGCECHIPDYCVMHFAPCCDYTEFKKQELELCKICKSELSDDENSEFYDCGGDCKKCVEEFENKS